jgi:hypothetical protein
LDAGETAGVEGFVVVSWWGELDVGAIRGGRSTTALAVQKAWTGMEERLMGSVVGVG